MGIFQEEKRGSHRCCWCRGDAYVLLRDRAAKLSLLERSGEPFGSRVVRLQEVGSELWDWALRTYPHPPHDDYRGVIKVMNIPPFVKEVRVGLCCVFWGR